MKVLLVVNSDIGRGNTIGFRFGKIAHQLRKQGIEFDILARRNYDEELHVEAPIYKNYLGRILNAIRIYFLPFFNYRDFEVFLFDVFVRHWLGKNNINYTIAHFGEYLPKSIKFLKENGVKIYLDMPIGYGAYSIELKKRGIKVGEGVEKVSKNIDEAIKLADVVIAPSEFVKHTLTLGMFGNKDIRKIPFGVQLPTDFTVEQIEKKLKNTQELIYLFVGNVNYRKGMKYLLEAWQKMGSENVRLIICGRVYKEIRNEIKKFHFDNVEFVGFVNLSEYYKKAHVFVFPTLLEGSSKAVYEAMSFGLPVITTYNAGSIIQDGHEGFVVPIGDIEELANRIQYFSDNRSKIVEMGSKAFETAQKYPWERYASNVVATYNV